MDGRRRQRERLERIVRRQPDSRHAQRSRRAREPRCGRGRVTVVASTGDAGPTNTIGSPTSAPGIINVGGSTTLRVYRQTTRYATQLVPGGWLNNNITALSSAG